MIEHDNKKTLKFRFDSYINKKEDIAINNKENILFIFMLLVSFQFLTNFFSHPTSTTINPEIKMVSISEQQKNITKTSLNPVFVSLFSPEFIQDLDSKKELFTPEAFEQFKKYTQTSIYYKDLIKNNPKKIDIKASSPAVVETIMINNQNHYTYYVPIVAITDKVYNINQTISFTYNSNDPNKIIITNIVIEDNVVLKHVSI